MAALDLFKATSRPDEDLFYARYDENDPRLGEAAKRLREDYKKSKVVIVGCPQDEGVARNRGRLGAKLAPPEIRRALYRLPLADAIREIRLFDLGDLKPGTTLEKTHDAQTAVVQKLLEDGKTVITLGGGNDIAYPDARAVARQFGRVLAFNIDAHLDVRADAKANSGTPYRQLLEEQLLAPELFHEIATQPLINSSRYLGYVRRKSISMRTLSEIQERGVDEVLRGPLSATQVKAIFWGFDMDSVRAADAPGVSAPTPTGLTAEQICRLGAIAGRDARTRVIEISEVNPKLDIDGRTSRLAALILLNALVEMAPHLQD